MWLFCFTRRDPRSRVAILTNSSSYTKKVQCLQQTPKGRRPISFSTKPFKAHHPHYVHNSTIDPWKKSPISYYIPLWAWRTAHPVNKESSPWLMGTPRLRGLCTFGISELRRVQKRSNTKTGRYQVSLQTKKLSLVNPRALDILFSTKRSRGREIFWNSGNMTNGTAEGILFRYLEHILFNEFLQDVCLYVYVVMSIGLIDTGHLLIGWCGMRNNVITMKFWGNVR